MSYKYEVNRGHIVNLSIAVNGDVTELSGTVTGVAESFGNPDNLRITIAGVSEWFDLSQANIQVARVA